MLVLFIFYVFMYLLNTNILLLNNVNDFTVTLSYMLLRLCV